MTIIVPYRNRQDHLDQFIPHMRAYLPDARIVVVEQVEGKDFNRGLLVNLGAVFAFDFLNDNAITIHDVDKLPIRADYSYPECPSQLVKSHRQRVDYLGGVTLFNKRDYEKVDGFSNAFWGWGGEDNCLMMRCKEARLKIEYKYGKFLDLPHPRPSQEFDQAKWDQAVAGRNPANGFAAAHGFSPYIKNMDGYTLLRINLVD